MRVYLICRTVYSATSHFKIILGTLFEVADGCMLNFINFTTSKFTYLVNTVELDKEIRKSLCRFVSVSFGLLHILRIVCVKF